MDIIFTRNNTILSRLIRKVTGEPVSHCALDFAGWIIHSNLYGARVDLPQEFDKHNDIVYRVTVPFDLDKLVHTLVGSTGSRYDFGALLYAGLRCVLPFLPKQNLWQCTGMFLCTEFVTSILYNTEDSEITPYQLYQRLLGSSNASDSPANDQ